MVLKSGSSNLRSLISKGTIRAKINKKRCTKSINTSSVIGTWLFKSGKNTVETDQVKLTTKALISFKFLRFFFVVIEGTTYKKATRISAAATNTVFKFNWLT